ncbi:AarF/ABC1/UbiB kinase family protein [bacterium]|nr:AarF/ABC1/UbiB kinase family protein [bacterium]
MDFNRLKRIKEIMSVLGKHGLTKYFPQTLFKKLGIWKPTEEKDEVELEKNIREAFEELGTTFIKLGQMMSLRSDIIPSSMAEEFKKLTDDVKPIEFEQIKPIIESELCAEINDIFSEFDENPIAAASISQVYGATLKENGEKVVVKVRKPGITETIREDMDLIFTIAHYINKTSYSQNIDFEAIAEEFFQTMNIELDLLQEKANNEKFIKNFSDTKWNWLKFPKMYDLYCTNKVLVMERIFAIKLDEVIKPENIENFDRKIIAERGAEVLMKMILNDGFFHADLHEGNIFFKENNEIAIIDTGMCGCIDKFMRSKLADLFIAFVAKDWEKTARICLELSENGAINDKELFVRDLRNIFENLPDNLSEINTAEVVGKISGVIFKYKLKIPRELTQLIRSFSMIEGLCRKLDPDFELLTVAGKLSKEIIMQKFTPENLAHEAISSFEKIVDTFHNMPDAMTNIIEKLENGTIQHRMMILLNNSERKFVSKMITRITAAFLMTGTLIAGSSMEGTLFTIDVIVFSASLILFLSTFFKGKND